MKARHDGRGSGGYFCKKCNKLHAPSSEIGLRHKPTLVNWYSDNGGLTLDISNQGCMLSTKFGDFHFSQKVTDEIVTAYNRMKMKDALKRGTIDERKLFRN